MVALLVALSSMIAGALLWPQFRSHPKLMQFSAEMVYAGRLRSGIDRGERRAVSGLAWQRQATRYTVRGIEADAEGCK